MAMIMHNVIGKIHSQVKPVKLPGLEPQQKAKLTRSNYTFLCSTCSLTKVTEDDHWSIEHIK